MQKLKDSYHTYAAVTIVFWALALVFTRLLVRVFGTNGLGFLRYLTASVVLFVVFLMTRMKLPARKDIPWLIASGFLGFFLYMIAFNRGMMIVTAATGSVVVATVPVMTAIIAAIVYHEKLTLLQWAATVIEFGGVVLLTLLHGALSVNTGLLWLLLGSVSLSIYNVLQKRLTKTCSALQTTTFSIFAGTVMLSVFAPQAVRKAAGAPMIAYVYLAILGVGSSALAYVSWTKAYAKAKKTSDVSNYMFLTPFLTSFLGFFIAGEVPDRATLIGGAVILTGVLIFNFGEKLAEMFRGQQCG